MPAGRRGSCAAARRAASRRRDAGTSVASSNGARTISARALRPGSGAKAALRRPVCGTPSTRDPAASHDAGTETVTAPRSTTRGGAGGGTYSGTVAARPTHPATPATATSAAARATNGRGSEGQGGATRSGRCPGALISRSSRRSGRAWGPARAERPSAPAPDGGVATGTTVVSGVAVGSGDAAGVVVADGVAAGCGAGAGGCASAPRMAGSAAAEPSSGRGSARGAGRSPLSS